MRLRFALAAWSLLATAPAWADTIHLAGGGTLRHARIVEERDATVVILVEAGGGTARLILGREEILKIERDAPDPDTPERPADLDRAFALLRELKPVEALLLLKPLATNGRWHAPARYGRSLAHEQLGDLEAAESEIRIARTLAPTDPWIAFHAAHLQHRRGAFTAAERGYRLAGALEPENRALKQLVREAIGAARARVAAPDPAAGRARATFDRDRGNVADAAAAAKTILDNPDLEVRGACTQLHVGVDADPAVLDAYGRGADAAGFRQQVLRVRATLTVTDAFAAAGEAARSLCVRQIHSALAHRYPNAAVVVEAREGSRVRAACFFDGTTIRVVFDPPPRRERW